MQRPQFQRVQGLGIFLLQSYNKLIPLKEIFTYVFAHE